jgi:hypothetical protein
MRTNLADPDPICQFCGHLKYYLVKKVPVAKKLLYKHFSDISSSLWYNGKDIKVSDPLLQNYESGRSDYYRTDPELCKKSLVK